MKKVVLLLVVLAAGFGAFQAYRLWTMPVSEAAGTVAADGTPAASGSAPASIAAADGSRGPGLHRQPSGSLALAVPATFDLSHVAPESYAAALGNDPERIFNFVRDEIAFEPYTGLLRGPRGTLLALAGNSVDRAALLASLLSRAGQQIRFARGTLPDEAARTLVSPTWARTGPPSSIDDAGTDAPLQEARQTFETSLKRDFALVWGQARTTSPGAPAAAHDFASLVDETRTHYWVQWSRDGAWIDLDPSFADATIGRTFAETKETLDTLPDALAHVVTIRIRVEEYTGATAAIREILTYTAKAADLSGIDLVLSHVPEQWQKPEAGLAGALTSSLADTGRIKPVLTVGARVIAGDVFAQQVKRTGIGGLGALLGGAGSRDAVPIATAEWLDVDLTAPNGRETVVRELYDLVGVAQRRSKVGLSANEVASRPAGARTFDATQALYDVLFTTGALAPTHLANIAATEPAATEEGVDVRAVLQRMNVAFMTTSDAILARLGTSDRSLIRFYPDAPRFVIAELSAPGGTQRLQMDLRRTQSRLVVLGSHLEDGLAASVLRGVVNGTLERTLVEYATAGARAQGLVSHMSTSAVFERAHAENAPILLLPRDRAKLDAGLSAHALARLDEDASRGLIAVAPQRPVLIAGMPRFGWWRIDPRTGETTAVTDEGLHQATEYRIVENESNGQVTIVVRTRTLAGISQNETTFNTAGGALRYIETLLERGATLVEGNFWLPPI